MATEYKQEDEIEIDLKELILEILGHWQMIVLSTLLVAVIAFVISKFVITPQYQSTSQLYVLSKSTSITSLSDLQLSTNLTNDYVVVIKGRPVLEQVIANLGLSETYGSLSSKVSVSIYSDSRIIAITVTDPSASRAKEIADEIADVSSSYISEKMDQDRPNILQYGYADGGQVSPNTKKNTVLGGLIGAIFAIVIVVISYLLNDAIMMVEEVEHKLGLHVLGVLPYDQGEDTEHHKKSGKRKKSA